MNSSYAHRAIAQREQLIESHLPLVQTIARRYAARGELEDLVQAGSLGLIRASDRFDPTRGVAFATFATPAIEGEIRRHLGDQTTSLRIPRELQRMARELEEARGGLQASLGRPPSIGELAAELGEKVEDVQRVLEADRARETVDASPDEVEVEEPRSQESAEARMLVARSARVLNERERRIVLLRYHRDMTEQQIAEELGISQAHVSRLLSGAHRKLRDEMSDRTPSPSTGADAGSRTRLGGVGVSQERSGGGGQPSSRNPKQQPAKRKAASGPSGRFLVRMPSTLHEELARAAERENVSLNRFVTDKLSDSVTDGPTAHESESALPATSQSARHRFRMLLVANVVVIVLAALVAIGLLVLALERGI